LFSPVSDQPSLARFFDKASQAKTPAMRGAVKEERSSAAGF
jgi:hypothetical protein